MLAILPACGGGGGGEKTPQTYTVTVNATAGTLQHSTTISVFVNESDGGADTLLISNHSA